MRVLVVSSSYPTHPDEAINAGVLGRDLALQLAELGHSVTVLTPSKPGGVIFDTSLDGRTIPWLRPSASPVEVAGTGLFNKLRMASLVLSGIVVTSWVVLRNRPDRIVALWALPSGLFVWAATRLRRVPYTVWALGSDIWRVDRFPLGRRFLKRVFAASESSWADGITLAAEAEQLTGESVSFLPSVRRLPKTANLPTVGPDIAYVGRFHPNKGPDVLVGAAGLLTSPGLTIEMYGDGEMTEELHAAIASNPLVTLNAPIGARKVAELLRSCRVLVIPSRIESIPLILGDAIQAGTTVVVSDVGDMGTIVRDYGLGLVTPKEDPVALAASIEAALRGEIPERLEARGLFSLERVAAILSGSASEPREGIQE